ncbi:hypothetical protein DDR33_09810 [Pararcticibacter amylolyticus]|uniref:Uncharacterized protein n=1 Tax=Pararcticibacter amylolyticus TaxID=2173175 RepID=A0A2U2PH59_9SPHI|nr:hypothetical protein DDR33_09810 [Pararcticibacter amylolyticus]
MLLSSRTYPGAGQHLLEEGMRKSYAYPASPFYINFGTNLIGHKSSVPGQPGLIIWFFIKNYNIKLTPEIVAPF